MNSLTTPRKLPAALATGSFIWMLGLLFFTNPARNVVYAMSFFLALCIFLIAAGYLITIVHAKAVNPKKRFKIYIASIFITVTVMFRSAGALGWLDTVVLALIALGLLFYGSRRA